MTRFDSLRSRARALKAETYALYLACRDPRTPWHAKLLATIVLAYALSPLDLIPDFVPVLGYVDDLILVPAGIALTLRLIPPEVIAECRQRARAESARLARSWRAGAVIIALWVLTALVVARCALAVLPPGAGP
jgi:uncharacterized membrane protein YkvA (DUF1232 family)